MRAESPALLVALLRGDVLPQALTGQEWEAVLAQARRGRLAARLGTVLTPLLLDDEAVPEGVRELLAAARLGASRVREQMQREAILLAAGLRRLGQRCVLLKGTAYMCADLPAAVDRLFGDIDILVPRSDLAAIEQGLLSFGWMASTAGAYDQRYYRTWMHELPPMTHLQRGTVLDVHHAVTPPTSAFHVPGDRMLSAVVPIDESRNLWMLQPVDMVLHSAVHLFTEGEFDHGLRDLLDLHDLLRHFTSHAPDFWPALFARAADLGLGRPLHHALHHAERLFGVLVPPLMEPVRSALQPPWPARWVMDWAVSTALSPANEGGEPLAASLARSLLYVRSHWLRMPLYLLLPHLLRKAWIGRFKAKSSERQPVALAIRKASEA